MVVIDVKVTVIDFEHFLGGFWSRSWNLDLLLMVYFRDFLDLLGDFSRSFTGL